MRRVWIGAVIAVALIGYWAWPYLGAYTLASAATHGNIAVISQRVDFPALRRSLARQIVEAYLRQSGRGQKMGVWERGLATAVGTTVADPYLEQLLSPDAIGSMLAQGRIGTITVDNRAITSTTPLPKLDSIFAGGFLHVLAHSAYDGIASFRFDVPDTEGARTYGIHLRLNGLVWRLSGFDLPPDLLDRIVADAVARQKAPSPQAP